MVVERAAARSPATMRKKTPGPSQLMELFLAVAGELGFASDRDVGALADVGPENVANWRSGAVREFKNQKFRAAVDNLMSQLRALRVQAHGFSKAAEAAITAAGGTVDVLPLPYRTGRPPVKGNQFTNR